jgi:hypothetical protein
MIGIGHLMRFTAVAGIAGECVGHGKPLVEKSS